jgi:hypothetical protein
MIFFPQEGSLVYCNNVDSRMEAFIQQYDPNDWILFIDSWKMGFGAVMVHNRNAYPAVPIRCAIHMKELYENVHLPVQHRQCDKYSCHLCGVTKVATLLVRLQVGDIKFCFISVNVTAEHGKIITQRNNCYFYKQEMSPFRL